MGQALGAEDEQDEMNAPDEEAQSQRPTRTPATPSAEEMAERCANGHIPCLDWCPDCNEAFGREWAHQGTDSLYQKLTPSVL